MSTEMVAAPKEQEARASKQNVTLDRGLLIMELFLDDSKMLTIAEISDRLAIPHSSVYRIVRSMRERDWLAVEPPGVYRLGNRLLTAVSRAESQSRLIGAAHPVLADLTAQTRETSLLTVVSGLNAVCLLRVEGPQAIRVSLRMGAVLPLHAGASSTVLLAFSPAQLIDRVCEMELTAYSAATVTEPDALRLKLASIREHGYAQSESEVDAGVVSVAAPVVSPAGQAPIAAVSVVAPSQQLEEQHLPDVKVAVLAAARSLSQTMFGS